MDALKRKKDDWRFAVDVGGREPKGSETTLPLDQGAPVTQAALKRKRKWTASEFRD